MKNNVRKECGLEHGMSMSVSICPDDSSHEYPTRGFMDISRYKIKSNSDFNLNAIKTVPNGKLSSKEDAEQDIKKNIEKMSELQSKLYAQNKHALLIVFQAMDTAGKDGVIKHVMTGLNPQGTQVHSFKQPSDEELNHDYLWRANKSLPERGHIGIFNRSYYEEVLIVKVHDLIKNQRIPENLIKDDIWEVRYRQIKDYEKYLSENGFVIVKIFLHISKEEQKQRLLARIEDRSKNWKFSDGDIKEREYWDVYQQCYEKAIENTSTKRAPWFIVPSDKKLYSRLIVSEIIVKTLEGLQLEYPNLNEDQMKMLNASNQKLLKEKA